MTEEVLVSPLRGILRKVKPTNILDCEQQLLEEVIIKKVAVRETEIFQRQEHRDSCMVNPHGENPALVAKGKELLCGTKSRARKLG